MKPESDGFQVRFISFSRGSFLGSMFSFPGCTIYDFVLRNLEMDPSSLIAKRFAASVYLQVTLQHQQKTLSPGSCLTVKTLHACLLKKVPGDTPHPSTKPTLKE